MTPLRKTNLKFSHLVKVLATEILTTYLFPPELTFMDKSLFPRVMKQTGFCVMKQIFCAKKQIFMTHFENFMTDFQNFMTHFENFMTHFQNLMTNFFYFMTGRNRTQSVS